MNGWTDTDINKQTEKYTDRQLDVQTDSQINRDTNRYKGRQVDRRTSGRLVFQEIKQDADFTLKGKIHFFKWTL